MALKLEPLLNQLTIKTKRLAYRKFDLRFNDPVDGDLGWAQRPFVREIERQYNSGKPVRIVVLKARQLGISTATEGTLFWWSFIHPGSNGLVMTHEKGQSEELFAMTRTYWDHWPFREAYKLQYSTRQQLRWTNNSQLRVATAGNVKTGRGSTLNAVHMSEAAFYEDPDTLWTGMRQTIPHRHGSIVIVESTANGVGNWFYDQWNAAESGESEFVPMFFPWYKHPEYTKPTTLTVRSELDSEEKFLLSRMEEEKVRSPMERVAWRRWMIRQMGDVASFMQEYPATAEEAFIVSGRPIFDHLVLKRQYHRGQDSRSCSCHGGQTGRLIDMPDGSVRWQEGEDGGWTIFKRPNRHNRRTDQYFISGDPSKGITGDPSCIQVINRETFEQVAVWHGWMHPSNFGYEMMKAGKFYNWAMLCPEIQGGGQVTINTILHANYPNIWIHRQADRVAAKASNVYGWSTNWVRRNWQIGRLQQRLLDGSVVLHDRITYIQLRNFVERSDGEWGSPMRGTRSTDLEDHDDAVMAFSIAIAASMAEGPFLAEPSSDSVIQDIYRQEYEDASLFV